MATNGVPDCGLIINSLLVPEDGSCDHDDDGDEEDEDGDAVHAMHEEDIGIARSVGIALFKEEILLYLRPDARFHSGKIYCYKDRQQPWRNSGTALYLHPVGKSAVL
jgi:hypothetical protein